MHRCYANFLSQMNATAVLNLKLEAISDSLKTYLSTGVCRSFVHRGSGQPGSLIITALFPSIYVHFTADIDQLGRNGRIFRSELYAKSLSRPLFVFCNCRRIMVKFLS